MRDCGCIIGSVSVPYKYSDLGDKPSINGIKIDGDVTLEAGDIPFDSSEPYEEGTIGSAIQDVEAQIPTGVLTIEVGGNTYEFDGSSSISITLPVYNGGVS